VQPHIQRLQELQPEFIIGFIAAHFDDVVAIHRRAVDGALGRSRPTARGAIDADAVAEVFTRAFLSLSLVTPGPRQSGGLADALLACWDGVAAVPRPAAGAAPRLGRPSAISRPSVGPRAAVVA
jgi:hypothetical protein